MEKAKVINLQAYKAMKDALIMTPDEWYKIHKIGDYYQAKEAAEKRVNK